MLRERARRSSFLAGLAVAHAVLFCTLPTLLRRWANDGDIVVYLRLARALGRGGNWSAYPFGALALFRAAFLATGPDPSIATYRTTFLVLNATCTGLIALLVADLARMNDKHWRASIDAVGLYSLLVVIGICIYPWRYDLVPALFTTLGVWLFTKNRWKTSLVALLIATSLKVYSIGVAAIVVGHELIERRVRYRVIAAFAVFGLALFAAVDHATHGRLLSAFLKSNASRSQQLESLGGGVMLLVSWLRTDAVVVKEYDTWTVHIPGAEALSSVSAVVNVIATGAVLVAVLRFSKSVTLNVRTFAMLCTALVTTVFVSNKVLSPQYLAWIIPFAPLLERRHGAMVVLISVLTTTVFPFMYCNLIAGEGLVVLLLNARNALLVWLVVDLLRSIRTASLSNAPSEVQSAARPRRWKRPALVAAVIGVAAVALLHRPYPWRARFFPSRDLTGTPVQRSYRQLHLSWSFDTPHRAIPPDNFSARFDTCLRLQHPTKVRFALKTDDGLRIFIDDRNVMDHWLDGIYKETFFADLPQGEHHIRVEYFEHVGMADVVLEMTAVPGEGRPLELRPPAAEPDAAQPCGA